MAVRSKRLVATVNVQAVEVLVYTVPAGETGLVKQVSVVNNGVTPRLIVLRSNTAGNGTAWFRALVPAQGHVQATGFWPFPPGHEIRAISDDVAGVILSLFGAELEGVAD